MHQTKTVYPLAAVRALALHAQGLTTPNGQEAMPTPDLIGETVDRLGGVQIDTLQMVHRSHYLAVWSRLGRYDVADFDRLIYANGDAPQNDRRLFEYWLHAACILPLRDYRYRLPLMHRHRQGETWNAAWMRQPENYALMAEVLARVQQGGPVRAAEFEDTRGQRRSSWWDWKPAKQALEVLYNAGELMVADRTHFQRVYDVRQRVLPSWVDATMPDPDETRRYLVERAVRAFGVCQPLQVADYDYRLRRNDAKPVLAALTQEGRLVEVDAELADGKTHRLLVHRDDLPQLAQAADGALLPRRTTFLSPFDNLFWPKGRDRLFWNFHQTLESYKPAPQRRWGYFCLPVLHHDRLVGRFDPKLERASGTLRLKAFHLEPGVRLADDLLDGMAAAMRDFLRFHNATDLVIERSEPAGAGDALAARL